MLLLGACLPAAAHLPVGGGGSRLDLGHGQRLLQGGHVEGRGAGAVPPALLPLDKWLHLGDHSSFSRTL